MVASLFQTQRETCLHYQRWQSIHVYSWLIDLKYTCHSVEEMKLPVVVMNDVGTDVDTCVNQKYVHVSQWQCWQGNYCFLIYMSMNVNQEQMMQLLLLVHWYLLLVMIILVNRDMDYNIDNLHHCTLRRWDNMDNMRHSDRYWCHWLHRLLPSHLQMFEGHLYQSLYCSVSNNHRANYSR